MKTECIFSPKLLIPKDFYQKSMSLPSDITQEIYIDKHSLGTEFAVFCKV